MEKQQEPLSRPAADGQLAVYRNNNYWHCMVSPRSVEALNRDWAAAEAL